MKKMLGLILFLASVAYATDKIQFDVDRTSNTAIAVTTLRFVGSGPGDYLMGYIVGVGGGNGSRVTVYDSSATATNKVLLIDTSSSTVASMFTVPISSGITITKTGTADVTFFWHNANRSIAQD